MAIRLNLLAEAQALEELRRRDPAKRAIIIGACAAVAMLVWSSSVQLRIFLLKSEVKNLETQVNSRTNEYNTALKFQKQLTDTRQKALALHQLATNRFLQGSALNALQQTVTSDVQLRRFRSEQAFVLTQASK